MRLIKKTRITLCTVCLFLVVILALASCNKITSEDSGSKELVGASINENGELVVSYSDGSQENLGAVVGSDGKDGKDGIDGKDGVDGKDGLNGNDGKDGSDGANGSLVISNSGNGIPEAISKGLRSSVSIVSKFTMTVQMYPGMSPQKYEYSSAGSGVIYELDKTSGDAFIITNYHVVYDANSDTDDGVSENISVYLYGSEISGKEIKATYVGGSLYYDIAVLKLEDSEVIKASDAVAVTLSDKGDVGVGETAIAIGNAQGYGISASVGIVSVDSEHITMTAADGMTSVSVRVMRVDTAVNSGNSGGGLFNDDGELIGIVNAKMVSDGVENIGYAIPTDVAVAIAENIVDYCYETELTRVQRAMLGISVTSVDSKATYNSETGRISIEETVMVYDVNEGYIAEGILEAGDILVSAELDGKKVDIKRSHAIIDMMLEVRAGDVVYITVKREVEGETKEMTLELKITEDCLAEY